jgi:hypothetical protein
MPAAFVFRRGPAQPCQLSALPTTCTRWTIGTLRSSARAAFGRVELGLIHEGKSVVSGVATLANVGWALSPSEMPETRHLHKIPTEIVRSGEVAKWTRILTDAATFPGSILPTMLRERLPCN